VVLLGHIGDIRGTRTDLAPDLKESLTGADKSEADFVEQVDQYIEKTGLEAPIEALPEMRDGFQAEPIPQLDLKANGITIVVWATGYRFDFRLVRLPTFDEDGYPLHTRDVTQFPGLYFVGLPLLRTPKSGLLAGVGEDAAHVASVIMAKHRRHAIMTVNNQESTPRQCKGLAME
jgi:putative flavoprotein involved in K+ transport